MTPMPDLWRSRRSSLSDRSQSHPMGSRSGCGCWPTAETTWSACEPRQCVVSTGSCVSSLRVVFPADSPQTEPARHSTRSDPPVTPTVSAKQLASELIGDIRTLDRRIKAVTATIRTEVQSSGSSLTDLYGVGPVVAARILGEVGDITRFPSRNHFASYTGTAPIEVSSADAVRHRLSRAGNRRINHAIHMAAVSQIRNHSPGHDYYQRKLSEGKSRKEALRCLKRRVSDAIYRQLVNDARQTT